MTPGGKLRELQPRDLPQRAARADEDDRGAGRDLDHVHGAAALRRTRERRVRELDDRGRAVVVDRREVLERTLRQRDRHRAARLVELRRPTAGVLARPCGHPASCVACGAVYGFYVETASW